MRQETGIRCCSIHPAVRKHWAGGPKSWEPTPAFFTYKKTASEKNELLDDVLRLSAVAEEPGSLAFDVRWMSDRRPGGDRIEDAKKRRNQFYEEHKCMDRTAGGVRSVDGDNRDGADRDFGNRSGLLEGRQRRRGVIGQGRTGRRHDRRLNERDGHRSGTICLYDGLAWNLYIEGIGLRF